MIDAKASNFSNKKKAKKIIGLVVKAALVGVIVVGMTSGMGGVARASATHFQDYLMGKESLGAAIVGDAFGNGGRSQSSSSDSVSESATGKAEDEMIGRLHEAFVVWMNTLDTEEQKAIVKEANADALAKKGVKT